MPAVSTPGSQPSRDRGRTGCAENRRCATTNGDLPERVVPRPRGIAENSLWHGLEEGREKVRSAGRKYSPRQYAKLKQAHDNRELIAQLCETMENYTGGSDPRYKEAMARVMKRGLETWEHVLIRKGTPWERYVTNAARRGAERCIADAQFYVPLV